MEQFSSAANLEIDLDFRQLQLIVQRQPAAELVVTFVGLVDARSRPAVDRHPHRVFDLVALLWTSQIAGGAIRGALHRLEEES